MHVSVYLLNAGIPSYLRGFYYLCDAIAIVIEDPTKIFHITKTLYPEVAKRYNATPAQVERSIRYAIGVYVSRGNPDLLYTIFGSSLDPDNPMPTNSEFISAFANYIKIQEQAK